MGLVQRVHFGESVIFMLNNLLFVMQEFLRTLYWRSLASMALEVLHRLMICFCRSGGGDMVFCGEFVEFGPVFRVE